MQRVVEPGEFKVMIGHSPGDPAHREFRRVTERRLMNRYWRFWYNALPVNFAMPVTAASDPKQAIGRAPERLTLGERLALTGKFIALEVYTPETLPLRRIEAIGDSIEDCVRQLTERGHDPMHFEFSRLEPPY